MKTTAMVLSIGLLAATAVPVHGQSTTDLNTQTTTMNNLAPSTGESNVIGKISGDFSSLLGADATAVVTGLRNGTPITLKTTTTTPGITPPGSTTPGTPTTTTTTTIITPPTGHMGHGNVYISLALAKQQLSALGITQPTPSQLQAALTGGTITQTSGTGTTATTTATPLDGILTLRSQNMGWGQIAQKLGYKLGPVMSSMKSANQQLASQTNSTGGTAPTTTTQTNNSGIVSAGGQVHGNSGQGNSSGKGSSSGIVSASGRGNAYGHGGGIVTGSGQSVGSTGGIVSGGGSSHGNGGGQAKGHSK